MTESVSADPLRVVLRALRPGEVRAGTVLGFDDEGVVVDLETPLDGPDRCPGHISMHELSWRRVADPSELFEVGQVVAVEVIGVDWPRMRVRLSAKACEDQVLRAYLLGIRRGEILTGTVAEVHNFGVFVDLDGEPDHHRGTGFIRVPELSWTHIGHPSDVVAVGQRVTVEVLEADTRRGQVAVSLKALQEDPLIRFAERVGEVVRGPVTKLAPVGVFVRVADGIEGLVPVSDLSGGPVGAREQGVRVGDELRVEIRDVDPERRRVRLSHVPPLPTSTVVPDAPE
ncbi:S1 RNA-binding domain-containing protein [Plantactinospora solaniradicis]|uniref:S1 RNA-binding domain-containing protein n=1 Tax=Plantactinospora solaniradicis TaxID=1723736 RepID=A0ABW1KEN7_9ACTN